MKIELPKLSVIFPNLNGNKDDLINLLNSIKKSIYQGKIETIMVDNGSTNLSVKWFEQKFPWVKIIKLKKNLGFAKAVNIGIKKARSEYLFVTNNDVVLDKNCLMLLVNYLFNHKEVGVVGGKIYNLKYKKKLLCSGLTYNFYLGRFKMVKKANLTQEVDWVAGCCFCFTKTLWKRLKGFDESFFFTGEELDFCLRAKKLGYKIIYFPKAYLWHGGGHTINLPEFRRFKYLEGYKSKLRLIVKHASLPQIFTAFLLQYLFFLPYRALILREHSFIPLIQATIWNLRTLSETLAARHKMHQ